MKGEVLDYLRRGEPNTLCDKPCRRVLFVMSTEAETSLTIVTSVSPEFGHVCASALAARIRWFEPEEVPFHGDADASESCQPCRLRNESSGPTPISASRRAGSSRRSRLGV